MTKFLIGRLLSAAVVVLGVSCLVFLLIHIVPGDPVEVMLGETASVADRQAMRSELGLDQPVMTQLFNFLVGLGHLDLGRSLHSKRPITDMLAERLPATLPLGAFAATRRNTAWDTGAMTFSMLGVSIPNFVMGPLLILAFSVSLGWLPVSGRDGAGAIVLPALTLGTSMAAILSRMVRAALLEILEEDYIRTARAKGLGEIRVLVGHAMINATLPVITVLGLQLGTLLGGAVITEFVFSWPGVGSLTIESIRSRDYPVLQACVLVISLAYVVVNTATDIVYAWLDPRIRLDSE
jgi:peptide/nickel transport system permease protein